jgi:Protein of unknown function (DUF3829)
MTSIRFLSHCLLTVSLCAALIACGRKADEPETVKTPAVAPTASQARSSEPTIDSVGNKLQGYIECYNQLDGKAQRSIARYASWVRDMKAGPTGSEKVVYGLYEVGTESVAKCRSIFTSVATAKPALAKLDAAGATYMDTLAAMDKLVAEAYTYYDRENYKDDKFAKGRELHAPLTSSFEAFTQASTAFSVALDAENDAMLEAQLVEVEKTQGRKLTYFRMALMSKAKQLAGTIGEETFDATKAGEQLVIYEKIADEALTYAKANSGDVPAGWSSVASASEEVRKSAKERVRRIRDKVPYNEGEKMMLKPGSAWMVDGSTEKFIKAYNSLVDASNRN